MPDRNIGDLFSLPDPRMQPGAQHLWASVHAVRFLWIGGRADSISRRIAPESVFLVGRYHPLSSFRQQA